MHTTLVKGKRVMVMMKDGSKLVGKFVRKDDRAKYIVVEGHGQIPLKKFRAVVYYNAEMDQRNG